MRIGLQIYGDMESLSGGYLYNRKLVSYLRGKGDDVEIISLPQRSYWRCLGDNFGKSLLERIAAAKLDILVQDAMAHPSLFLLNRRIGLPVVTLVHLLTSFERNPWYSAWFRRYIERQYLLSVSGLIANSRTTLAQAGEILNRQLPAHCLAVPAGDHFPPANLGQEEISRRALASGPLKILSVGNVIRRKGLHVLIQALGQLPPDDYRLNVVGRLDMEPRYVKQVQKLIDAAQLQGRVTLLGPVQGRALVDLYRQHHLMALPSAYESYGIVYVEAQQFGLPVLGTTAGAAQEIIRHGDNGYLIPPEDRYALAALLQKLHQYRRLLLQLSRNALAAYAKQPTWAESCEIIRQYLHAELKRAKAVDPHVVTITGHFER